MNARFKNYVFCEIFILEGVTVGEPIQAHVNFDYSKFGYSSKADSSVGFYSEKCGIQEFF